MANEVKLESYYIEVRNLIKKSTDRTRKTGFSLDDIDGLDFIDVLTDFLKNFTFSRDNQLQRTFSILKLDDSLKNDRLIAGIYESGEFGYSSKVKNSTGKHLLDKGKEESNDIPFFFLFFIPKGKTKGILIFQRLGRNGGYTMFKKKLVEYCNSSIPNKKLEFSTILSKQVAKEMISTGIFKELLIKKHYVPRDKFDLLDSRSNDETITSEVNLVLSLKASQRGKSLGLKKSLSKFLDEKDATAFSIPELDTYIGKFPLVSTKIRYNGVDRMLDLSESMQIKPMYDISEDVKRDSGGHPLYNDILKVSKSILEDLKTLK